MSKLKLLSLITTPSLNEAMVAPSDQVMKGAIEQFKQMTSINVSTAGLNNIKLSAGQQGQQGEYEIPLDHELKSAIQKAIFRSLSLKVTITPVPNQIGGFNFVFSFVYMHPDGIKDSYNIGKVNYFDNKYKSVLFSKVEKE